MTAAKESSPGTPGEENAQEERIGILDEKGEPVLDEEGNPITLTPAEFQMQQAFHRAAYLGTVLQGDIQKAALGQVPEQMQGIVEAIIVERMPQLAQLFNNTVVGSEGATEKPYWGVELGCDRMVPEKVRIHVPKDYTAITSMNELIGWLFTMAMTLTAGPHVHAQLSGVEVSVFETVQPPPGQLAKPPAKKLILPH